METSTPSSTITDSSSTPNNSQPAIDANSSSSSSNSPNTNQTLEITLVSAQDIAPVCKSLRTYALAWVNPNRKRTTRVDNQGHTNPTWNDKFSFRVDDEFLNCDSSAVHVEIYTVSWFRDILVGTVKVLVNNLIINHFHASNQQTKRFIALQIRRPSGNPQGILNMGVALIDKSKRRPLFSDQMTPLSLDDHRDILDKKINAQDVMMNDKLEINNKIKLWQSQVVNNEEFPNQAGSVCNGSLVNGSIINNGSELFSDIGPSASIVAAEIAKKLQPMPSPPPQSKAVLENNDKELLEDDRESSILEELTPEEVYAKGLILSSVEERKKEKSQLRGNGHVRRNTDGGLYSCFGNAYCFEFTIVCGASSNNQGNRRINTTVGKTRKKLSDTNSA